MPPLLPRAHSREALFSVCGRSASASQSRCCGACFRHAKLLPAEVSPARGQYAPWALLRSCQEVFFFAFPPLVAATIQRGIRRDRSRCFCILWVAVLDCHTAFDLATLAEKDHRAQSSLFHHRNTALHYCAPHLLHPASDAHTRLHLRQFSIRHRLEAVASSRHFSLRSRNRRCENF